MAVYYKPQSPIQSGEDFIYPITTADQVKVDKDTRLNAVGVYLKNIDNSTDTTVYGNNATTLGGVAAEDYALKTDTAPDSSKLGGVAASDYALKTDTAPDSSKLGGKSLAEIMLDLYPVGAVYISVSSTSPASLFGGTWERINGRFLLASGYADTNTDSYFGHITGRWSVVAGSTGGQDYHTLTVDEMPSHTHESQYVVGTPGQACAGMFGSTTSNWWSPDYIRSTGGGQRHNNMPPYLGVNMWKRVE